jgi:small subunit ribosomal protein S4
VDIASYQCRPGDVIGVRNQERSQDLVKRNMEYPGLANLPSHLEFDKNTLVGQSEWRCGKRMDCPLD